MVRTWVWGFLLLLAFTVRQSCRASDLPADFSEGAKWFPKFWRAYDAPRIARPNLANGRRLLEMTHDGKIEVSVAQLNALVEENSLDLLAARYNLYVAETDILRAKSGQAARGAPGVALPGAVFASALGAGVGSVSAGGGGGTGPAAISAAARQVVVGPRGTFDPDIQVSVSFDHATSPLNTVQVAGTPTVVTPSTAVLTRFEKAFSTGFSFSVSFNSQRQTSTQQFLRFDPAYTARLSLSANQPLLNGFGLAVNRRFINIAKNDVQISREQFRQQLTSALVNAQNAYWDLVAARENVDAARGTLTAAQRLYEDSRKQLELGMVAALDVIQSESAVAASRRDLISAQGNREIKDLQLKALISKSVDTLSDVELVTTDVLPRSQLSDIPPFQEALKTALANRSELRQAQLNIRNQAIAENFTRNGLKPSLSIFAMYASSSLQSAIGPMVQEVWQAVPYPEYAVGLSLAISLRNRSAQADYIRARLELSQAQTGRTRTENQIALDVRGALIALVQARAQTEAAARAVESARVAFDAEQTKMRLGASTPYRTIQFQRDYVAAQAQELQARVSYAKARVQLDRVCGQTLARNNVSLDEVVRDSH